MIIEEKEINNYTYVSVKFNAKEDKKILDKIKQKAKEDALKVNKKSPDGIIRENDLIGYNNLGGVLAEKIVKLYLNQKAEQNNIKVNIFSPPFTGHFEHRDIKINLNGKEKTIEIRSSFQYKQPDLNKVISSSLSLIGPYTTSYKGEEPEKDFFIQVFHRYFNPEIIEKIENEIEAIIIGGVQKNLEMKMAQNKRHKLCVQNSKNKIKGSHNCLKESTIFRNSDVHYLDLECHPINPKSFKPCAIECECNSSKLQRESNKLDLLEWKKENPTGEIFQIENAEQFDINKLKRFPTFQRPRFTYGGNLR